jgi:stage II sporulation protein D
VAGLAAAIAALGLAPALAHGATWVTKGRGSGHGVGMSQYGAFGLAQHGSGYRQILDHYYVHTRIGETNASGIKVLLDSGPNSVAFSKAVRACGKDLNPDRTYKFVRANDEVVLRRSSGKTLKRCGAAGTASGEGVVKIGGLGRYRGDLKARTSSAGGLLVINEVGLTGYVRGVIANEMPSSWPKDALRAQAVAARSYALASRSSGPFDVYDDTRSQVYGGKDSETKATNRATRATAGEVVEHSGEVATTYFFSSSGGRTENVEFGFPGSSPVAYLKSVGDPYDDLSPDHRWKVTLSQSQMESRLSGLFGGNLRRIDVLKRGVSPRIVRARVVGSTDSSKVLGTTLQSRLGTTSTWMHFHKR